MGSSRCPRVEREFSHHGGCGLHRHGMGRHDVPGRSVDGPDADLDPDRRASRLGNRGDDRRGDRPGPLEVARHRRGRRRRADAFIGWEGASEAPDVDLRKRDARDSFRPRSSTRSRGAARRRPRCRRRDQGVAFAPLAFQANGQDCGYYADSSTTTYDKLNAREGRYPIWGAHHWIANTDTSMKPVGVNGNSAAVATVISHLMHRQHPAGAGRSGR